MKNNESVCILINPAHFEKMMEILEDDALYKEAEKRIKVAETQGYISMDEVLADFGINESELDDIEEINL